MDFLFRPKEAESIADLVYRIFAGVIFTLCGLAGVFLLISEPEIRGFLTLSFTLVLLMIALACFFPKSVGGGIYRILKLLFRPTFHAIRHKVIPGIMQILHSIKLSSTKVPVPGFLKTFSRLIDEEAERHELFFGSAWYIRYPLALVGLTISLSLSMYALGEEGGIAWAVWLWVLIIGGYTLIYARELVLLCLGCFLLYWCFQGIAAMPVSVAIVLGAIVIASAIGFRRN